MSAHRCASVCDIVAYYSRMGGQIKFKFGNSFTAALSRDVISWPAGQRSRSRNPTTLRHKSAITDERPSGIMIIIRVAKGPLGLWEKCP